MNVSQGKASEGCDVWEQGEEPAVKKGEERPWVQVQGERPAPRGGGMLVRGRELGDVPDVLPGPSALTYKNKGTCISRNEVETS